MSNQFPNTTFIEALLAKIDEEYNLESRLPRYESTTPELIEFAKENGYSDINVITRALFLADFIITSSEVPTCTDEERRLSIIKTFSEMMEKRCDDPDKILRIFYLAYNLAVQLRRNNSFLAGRGVETPTRTMILIELYLLPYLKIASELLGTNGIYHELSILAAALHMEFPDHKFEEIPEGLDWKSKELLNVCWFVMSKFLAIHDAEVNDTVVLPSISESRLLLTSIFNKKTHVSAWNCISQSTKESVDAIKEMTAFFNKTDKENKLVYMRGKLVGTDTNLIIVRDPDLEGNPVFLMQTPADEINVTEMMSLMNTITVFKDGWIDFEPSVPIVEREVQHETISQEKWVEEEVEVQVPPEKPQKLGFFARLKQKLFGKKDSTQASEKKTVTRKKKVTENVEREFVLEKKIGVSMPDFVSHGLGILALCDLRMFEQFDTIRESEYIIVGAMESDFNNNKTTFITTEDFEEAKNLATLLDGLDEVIERTINFYFGQSLQILPTEIVFISDDGHRFVVCMDGTEERIVGTIAKTYVKDVSDWLADKEVDKLQRRSLHMRAGQLLSARQHTPFDQAVERIMQIKSANEDTHISLEHAILPIN